MVSRMDGALSDPKILPEVAEERHEKRIFREAERSSRAASSGAPTAFAVSDAQTWPGRSPVGQPAHRECDTGPGPFAVGCGDGARVRNALAGTERPQRKAKWKWQWSARNRLTGRRREAMLTDRATGWLSYGMTGLFLLYLAGHVVAAVLR